MKPPVHSQSIEELIETQMDLIPEDLIIRQPDCPPALSALVKQMLATQASMRPTFGEVLNELIGIEINHLTNQSIIQF